MVVAKEHSDALVALLFAWEGEVLACFGEFPEGFAASIRASVLTHLEDMEGSLERELEGVQGALGQVRLSEDSSGNATPPEKCDGETASHA